MSAISIKIEGAANPDGSPGRVRIVEIDTTDALQVIAPTYARLTHLEPAVTNLANAIGCRQYAGFVTPIDPPAANDPVKIVTPIDGFDRDKLRLEERAAVAPAPASPIPSSIFKGRNPTP